VWCALLGARFRENKLNPDPQRRDRISTYLGLAGEFISAEDFDFERAKVLRGIGFSDMDTLHNALSEKGQADFFITCDDRIVNLFKKNSQSINVKIISLLEFVGKGGEMG
jgi:hypothetical protein